MSDEARNTLLSVVEQVPGHMAEYLTLKPAMSIEAMVLARLRAVAGDPPQHDILVKAGNPGVVIAETAAVMGPNRSRCGRRSRAHGIIFRDRPLRVLCGAHPAR